MYRRLLALTLFTIGIAILATPAAAQTSGATNISINMPSFVMLYYRSSVTISPNNATMTALIGETTNPADLETVGVLPPLTSFVGDAQVNATSTGYTGFTSAAAVISNFWAVRSLAPNGGSTRVSVAWGGGGATETLSNTFDTMTLSALETQASGGSWGAFDTFPPTGLGAGAATLGNVRFNVDLSGVATSGNYTGGAIFVTAENI